MPTVSVKAPLVTNASAVLSGLKLKLPRRLVKAPVIVCSMPLSILNVILLPDPVSVIVIDESFLAIWLTPTLPVMFTSPDVLIDPVVASIVSGPTVRPLRTTKFPFAIVPYLPVGYFY